MWQKRRFLRLVSLVGVLAAFGLPGPAASADDECSTSTRIILVRHGQTAWNVLGLLQGNANIPLDATGIGQAQALAQSTVGKTIHALYSSPLSRAFDTAQAIAVLHPAVGEGECEADEQEHLEVDREKDLREIGVGIYTGFRSSDVPLDIRTAFNTNPDFAFPSGIPDPTNLVDPAPVAGIFFKGDSLNKVLERSWEAITEIAEGQTVVVVTHGGVIQIALTQVNHLPVTDYRTFSVPNASQTVLEFRPDGSIVVLPTW